MVEEPGWREDCPGLVLGRGVLLSFRAEGRLSFFRTCVFIVCLLMTPFETGGPVRREACLFLPFAVTATSGGDSCPHQAEEEAVAPAVRAGVGLGFGISLLLVLWRKVP